MVLINLLKNPVIQTLNNEREAIQGELSKYARNIFTLSNSGSHLELFHSDILKELLIWSNQSSHSSNLKMFIEYINQLGERTAVCTSNYLNVTVEREYKNIDILIADQKSKHCIIVENKINNAGDQVNQLKNYHDYMREEQYHVDAIIYLTLSGDKSAPKIFDKETNDLIIEMVAFNNHSTDLVHGFLDKVQLKANQDFDLQSLIYQYSKLLKFLSQKGMDRRLKQDFYELISEKEKFEALHAASKMLNELHIHRADEFDARLNNKFEPFAKKYRYKPHYWLFEKFIFNGLEFKLDIQFNQNGSAQIDFWIPMPVQENGDNVAALLTKIGMVNEFNFPGFGYGKSKVFEIDNYTSLQELDNAFFNFVCRFLSQLKTCMI